MFSDMKCPALILLAQVILLTIASGNCGGKEKYGGAVKIYGDIKDEMTSYADPGFIYLALKIEDKGVLLKVDIIIALNATTVFLQLWRNRKQPEMKFELISQKRLSGNGKTPNISTFHLTGADGENCLDVEKDDWIGIYSSGNQLPIPCQIQYLDYKDKQLKLKYNDTPEIGNSYTFERGNESFQFAVKAHVHTGPGSGTDNCRVPSTTEPTITKPIITTPTTTKFTRPTTTSSYISMSKATSTVSTSSPGNNTSHNISDSVSGQTTVGTIAGAATAVMVAVLIIILSIVFLMRRKRKHLTKSSSRRTLTGNEYTEPATAPSTVNATYGIRFDFLGQYETVDQVSERSNTYQPIVPPRPPLTNKQSSQYEEIMNENTPASTERDASKTNNSIDTETAWKLPNLKSNQQSDTSQMNTENANTGKFPTYLEIIMDNINDIQQPNTSEQTTATNK